MTVAVAALVPGALVGWLVWQAVGDSGGGGSTSARSTASAGAPGSSSAAPGSSSASRTPTASGTDDGKPPSSTLSGPAIPAASDPPAAAGPLRGKVVVIDPGHNPGNFQHSADINRKVNIGTNWKECDTTGTSTNAGYSEARFTLDVARRCARCCNRRAPR